MGPGGFASTGLCFLTTCQTPACHRLRGHLLRCAERDRARAGRFPSAPEAGFTLTWKFPYLPFSASVSWWRSKPSDLSQKESVACETPAQVCGQTPSQRALIARPSLSSTAAAALHCHADVTAGWRTQRPLAAGTYLWRRKPLPWSGPPHQSECCICSARPAWPCREMPRWAWPQWAARAHVPLAGHRPNDHIPPVPRTPAEDHRLRSSVIPHTQTQPCCTDISTTSLGNPQPEDSFVADMLLGHWRPLLGVKWGHALHLRASVTGEGRAGLPLPGGTVRLGRLPPGSRTHQG